VVVIEEIAAIELIPVTETLDDVYQGFFVRAFKQVPQKKIGFLMNGIRTVIINQHGLKSDIQTKIFWLPGKKTMVLEEYNYTTANQNKPGILLNIKFNDLNNPVIVKGRLKITKNTFKGKNMTVSWLYNDHTGNAVINIRNHNGRSLSCEFNQKKKTVDIQVEV